MDGGGSSKGGSALYLIATINQNGRYSAPRAAYWFWSLRTSKTYGDAPIAG